MGLRRLSEEKYGSLATHRGFLGMPPRRGAVQPFPLPPAQVFARQVAGLKRRLKALGKPKVVLGLSGGLDSTLALLVAVAAFEQLGLDRAGIVAVTMPGFGTSSRTRGNSERLSAALGLKLRRIDIGAAARRHLKAIGHDGVTPDVTYENAQARIRTLILMDLANLVGGIVLGTGDLSEIALGWCTYNGDHMSMFAVNNGVPKTVVRAVAAWWCGRHAGPAAAVIRDVIATPISPELVKGQVTEQRIGPYELHDFFLWNFIVNEMGPDDLAAAAQRHFGERYAAAEIAATLKVFLRRFFTQSFKRNCQPDGIRVYGFDLSLRGWWIPSDLGPVRFPRRRGRQQGGL